jgi:uncharacterized repeat protein (TIGR03803 family)
MSRAQGILLAAALGAAMLGPAEATGTYRVLHNFSGGSDGENPVSSLITDTAGNLYGTTILGGEGGLGTIFRIDPDGNETVLYAFKGGSDGAQPNGPLVLDGTGILYGTTISGGDLSCGSAAGCGTVFKLAPDGTKTVLYAFKGGMDGRGPGGKLFVDKKGNFYGTTAFGGGAGDCNGSGCGTVFRLTPRGRETVLHAFAGGVDGSDPWGGVIADSVGNLYGTTFIGGNGCSDTSGCGTVFKLARDGSETVLHAFAAGRDGAAPEDTLLADGSGNLYGTTYGGGGGVAGTLFKIAPDGMETTIHVFTDRKKGGEGPGAGLVADSSGNLYGTTIYGGESCAGQNYGCGIVFKLAPDGTEEVLHRFNANDGAYPHGGVIIDSKGNIYGTAVKSGSDAQGAGVVFELSP